MCRYVSIAEARSIKHASCQAQSARWTPAFDGVSLVSGAEGRNRNARRAQRSAVLSCTMHGFMAYRTISLCAWSRAWRTCMRAEHMNDRCAQQQQQKKKTVLL